MTINAAVARARRRTILDLDPNVPEDTLRAARRLVEIVSTIEPVHDGRIHVEKINGPFLFQDKASPAEYGAGMKRAIERGWLVMHESGTLCGSPSGADLFA
jgi:hypothetical protein